MSSNSKSVEMLVEQKRKYREHVRNMSLVERLQQLESLQEQTYDILRVRELNGGPPIPKGWQAWDKAQEELKK
jgi:hypothetical protein